MCSILMILQGFSLCRLIKGVYVEARFAHVTTVNVLTAEPTIPAINAPIIAWLTNLGKTTENQSAIPGSDRYPMNPIPNPKSQNEKIASPRDKLSKPP
jgi:hypothetical protein